MAQFTAQKFPQYEDQIKRFAIRHREFKEEPLLLAIVYEPERNPNDIFLFEVAENFGNNEIDPNKEFMETVFKTLDTLPLNADKQLHLVLTNPAELRLAIREQWPSILEIKNAMANDKYEVLFAADQGEQLLEEIRR